MAGTRKGDGGLSRLQHTRGRCDLIPSVPFCQATRRASERAEAATPSSSTATHRKAKPRLVACATAPIAAGPARMPATQCGHCSDGDALRHHPLLAGHREQCRHDVGAAQPDQHIARQRHRERGHQRGQGEACCGGDAAEDQGAGAAEALDDASPNRRIAVIARVNNAKPAPAWSRGTCRTSARNTALQSSIEPSARNTTNASTPMNSTTPCGSASNGPSCRIRWGANAAPTEPQPAAVRH